MTKIWYHVFNAHFRAIKSGSCHERIVQAIPYQQIEGAMFAPVLEVLKRHIVVEEVRLKEVHVDPLDRARVV